MDKDCLMTADELANHLRVTLETVRTWTRRGAIPSLRLSSKVIRYDLSAVRAALAKAAETSVRDE